MAFSLKQLGENIRKIRESRPSAIKPGKPMLQYELARLAQIPASSLSNIEKGKYRNPSWNILSRISRALGCDVADFFRQNEPKISAAEVALKEMIDLIVKEKLEVLLKEKTGE